ncbi:MAG: hypothetical protein ACPHVS_02810, partial [Alcanivorax sp.]|uniref:hypothetical protein n=1 Tax=Alcanivorax sp. TaxID=1872427 RepID=UPI003C352983
QHFYEAAVGAPLEARTARQRGNRPQDDQEFQRSTGFRKDSQATQTLSFAPREALLQQPLARG